MLFPDFSVIGVDVLLVFALGISFVGIIAHYFISFWPLARFKKTHLAETTATPPISVIICARNEDDNLTEFLPQILSQDYPEYEVVVVNDCSYDSTENVIDEFARIFSNLKKVVIKEDDHYKHGKKFAVMVGIKGAKYEHLVFTDADCFPASKLWLREMAKGFTEGQEVVLGFGAYRKQKGFLNRLIRFDTLSIGLTYLSAAIRKRAYMGVGRNLAYKKSLFFRHKGFSNHYHVGSGDDDLFLNEACTPDNTNISVAHDSITYSVPEKSFGAWKNQKRRHLTTAPYYNSLTKLRLGLGYLSQYLFHVLLIASFFLKTTIIIAGGVFLLKVIVQMIIFKKGSEKLNEKDLWWLSFFYELLLLFIYPVFHLSKLLYRPNKWKN